MASKKGGWLTKKAQSSFEFTIIVGFVLVAFALFFLAMQISLEDELSARTNQGIKEIALIVKNEVDLASESINGYSRNFTLPINAYGSEYEIWINQSTVFVKTTDNKNIITMPLKEVEGDIIKFENKIIKENGKVKIN